ncbi:5584_t:CDS:2, partial [Cetraspora pellucida]
ISPNIEKDFVKIFAGIHVAMMSKDLTKPFFHGENKDDINGFLFDYERFAKSKELIKTKTQWSDLKDAIVKIINAENDDRTKINRLRNIRQGERVTARGYASRFEAYTDVIKNKIRSYEQHDWFLDGLHEPYRSRMECFCPFNYIKARECVLQIETFQKDKEHRDKRGLLLVEEKSQPSKSTIDSITTVLEALTINWVNQEASDVTKIDKIEADIKELVKVVKKLTSSTAPGHSVPRNQYPTRGSRTNIDNQQCFKCQQEGHISCNCPNQDLQGPPVEQRNELRNLRNEDVEIRGANIRYFEITSTTDNPGVEYLKVKMVRKEPIFNIRNYNL